MGGVKAIATLYEAIGEALAVHDDEELGIKTVGIEQLLTHLLYVFSPNVPPCLNHSLLPYPLFIIVYLLVLSLPPLYSPFP